MNAVKKTEIDNGVKVYNLEPEKKETTSGLYVSAGEISTDYDKVAWKELLEDFTNMRNGGAVESSTISILKYPILRAGYVIQHENEELVKYIEWCLNNLTDSFGEKDGFQEFYNHLFLGIDYGCSFFEKIYRNGVYTPDGKITNIIQRLAPFKPETIWEFHYDSEMQFAGIRHERREAEKINSFVDIPKEKLFFYAHNAEFGDPRGRSELRPIRNLYKIKKDILLATARAQQRGAGIPEIKAKKGGLTAEEKDRMHSVGRTLGNMKSGYVVTDDSFDIVLHSLQIQGSPENTLEFINREMFFNTLTEFMTSGIGQNGSRSATNEHKGSYELKCGVITQAIEKRMGLLLREMTDISYFGPQQVYPTFKINALQQTDIISVSDSLIKFYDKAIITKQEGDEDFIRGLFNMPERVEVAPAAAPAVPEPDVPVKVAAGFKQFSNKQFLKVLSAEEQLAFVRENFDVKATEDLYLNMQQEASNIIDEVMQKYILYIAKQYEAGKPVEMKYDTELSNRLNKVFKQGYAEGLSCVKREIEKVARKKGLDAGTPPEGTRKGISQTLIRFAGRLLFNIKTVVEDQLETDWNRGQQTAIDYVIEKEFDGGFKTDRRTLIQKTTDGYLIGRGDALAENKDKIELYFYNSILDARLCDHCAILTGAVLTEEEAAKVGLQINRGRVNPNCLGGIGQCRCFLMPYKLKGDFIV